MVYSLVETTIIINETRIEIDSTVEDLHRQRLAANLCGVDGYEVLGYLNLGEKRIARVAVTYDLPEENFAEVLRPQEFIQRFKSDVLYVTKGQL